MKNILILNAGTRNKIIKDFKKDLDDRVKIIVFVCFFLFFFFFVIRRLRNMRQINIMLQNVGMKMAIGMK